MFRVLKNGELTYKDQIVTLHQCFPELKEEEFISLRDGDGNELNFLKSLDDLETSQRSMLRNLLKKNLQRIEVESFIEVKEEVELRYFKIVSKRGHQVFYTRLDDWPKRLDENHYLFKDIHEDEYLVNIHFLDKKSFKLISGLLE